MNCIKKDNGLNINDAITASEVRLIGADKQALGIVKIEKAMELAEEEGFDLVEIAPKAKPPVCKIMNYSKYKYEQEKRKKEDKKKQKTISVKEIRLRPNIDKHDLDIKVKRAKDFLEKGNKVRFNLRFRGRENAYKDQGVELLDRIGELLEGCGKIDKNINPNKRLYLLEVTPIEDNKK